MKKKLSALPLQELNTHFSQRLERRIPADTRAIILQKLPRILRKNRKNSERVVLSIGEGRTTVVVGPNSVITVYQEQPRHKILHLNRHPKGRKGKRFLGKNFVKGKNKKEMR